MQIGKIAGQVATGQKQTSLQVEINRFVLIIAALAVGVGVIVVCVWAGFLNVNHPSFMNTATMVSLCALSIFEQERLLPFSTAVLLSYELLI